MSDANDTVFRRGSSSSIALDGNESSYNPDPQVAPGASAAVGHTVENSIPLSIFPIAADKLCIIFCGLPGRGKTHIAKRLAQYLSFFHAIPVKVCNVGEYRLNICGAIKDAEWFDSNNVEANKWRSICNEKASDDLREFLLEHSNGIGILDGTNPTHKRRFELIKKLRPSGAKILFIEVTNDDQTFLTEQYECAVTSHPDYQGLSSNDAVVDYRRRIDKYVTYYEPLDSGASSAVESKWSYFKCDHSQQHFVVHNVRGNLPLKVINFVMNLRTNSHPFYLSRHGQSEYNAVGRIGGDSHLSDHGVAYAHALAKFVEDTITKNNDGEEIPARLWTSTLRRTKETAQFIKQNTIFVKENPDSELMTEWIQMRPRAWHHLDELFAGACDGMTYEEIEEKFPQEFERRSVDKLAYRYPRGESYLDVIARLEPMIIEMERHREPLLVVGHQGILRIIYAFYMGLTRAEAPYVSIPLNTVIELVPSAFKCAEKRTVLYTPKKSLPKDGQDEPLLNSSKSNSFNIDPQSH